MKPFDDPEAARAKIPGDVQAFLADVEARAKAALGPSGYSPSELAQIVGMIPRLIAIVREQGATIERLKSYEGERMQHEGFYTAEIARVVNERDELRARLAKLEAGLSKALDEWEYASQYKGEYLAAKHGDAGDIAELRKLLNEKGGA